MNFFMTTLYTYYEITNLLFNVTGSLEKFHHGKIRLAVEFESSNE